MSDNQIAKPGDVVRNGEVVLSGPDTEQPSQIESMFQVVARAATDPNTDPEKVERLYAIMERERTYDAEKQFNAAFVKAQEVAQGVKKSLWNRQTKSWYADQGDVADEINDVFNQCGISISFSEGETKKADYVRCQATLRHAGGHTETHHIDMPVVTTGAKGNAMMTLTHAVQSAFTYGKRNLSVLLANLPTFDKDRDGNSPVQEALALITEEQALEIDAFITDNDLPREVFVNWLKQSAKRSGYSIENIGDLRANQFDTVMKKLRESAK